VDKGRIINLLEKLSFHRKSRMHLCWTLRALFSRASFTITVLNTPTEEIGLLVTKNPICSRFIRVKLCRLEQVWIFCNFAGEEAFRRRMTLLLLPYLLLKEHLLLVVDTFKFFFAELIVRIMESLDEYVLRVLRKSVTLFKHDCFLWIAYA